MHALIIEDEALIALVIEDALRDFGYSSVTIAATQAEAVEAAKSLCPDLITADDRLIEGSGIDAVRIICADKVIPTVFILGDADAPADVVPHAYLMTKPFMLETLEDAVERAIMRARDHQGARRG